MTTEDLNNIAPHTETQGINQLLNRKHPEGYRSEWTRRVAQNLQEKDSDEYTSLIFRVGFEWLALPAARIREVAVMSTLHTLPHRHSALLGLISVRGELLICVDIAAFLEINQVNGTATDTNQESQLLIVVTDQGPLAFPVSAVHGFYKYQEKDLKALPSTLSGASNIYTYSILHWQGHSVGCLDAQALFRAINRSL